METSVAPMDNKLQLKSKVVVTITDFGSELQNKWIELKRFKSNVFGIGSDRFRIYIDCEGNEIRHYLCLKHTDELSVDVQYDVFIIDKNQQPFARQRINQKTLDVTENYWSYHLLINKQDLINQTGSLLIDNTLSIAVDMTVHQKYRQSTDGCSWLRTCSSDQLFGVRELCDCRLIVGKDRHEFYASKLLLSCRSEVFAKMFTTDCMEKLSAEVVIDDIEPQVFEQFLRYLYTGRCDQLDDYCQELLVVADKYLVGSLKTMCFNWYSNKISSDNAFKTLKLLQDFGGSDDEELMAKTVDFISRKISSIVGQEIGQQIGIKTQMLNKIKDKIDKIIAKK
ncbi:speckle-type POZ protein-like [Oppia nitens]|uniref:speckle-type POZ protein-like n=1 Tax=Oppia nitens TaxID=1686743 RepID=UPI0023DA1AC2|nr:speckle-type POZ protein-like [Oppia nitens]